MLQNPPTADVNKDLDAHPRLLHRGQIASVYYLPSNTDIHILESPTHKSLKGSIAQCSHALNVNFVSTPRTVVSQEDVASELNKEFFNRPLVAKIVEKQKCSQIELSSCLNELDILKKFSKSSNNSFLELLDHYEDSRQLKMFFEFSPIGDLRNFAKNRNFSERVIRSFAQQMLRAVNVLHAHSYVHFDVKPENILVFPNESDLSTISWCDDLADHKEFLKEFDVPMKLCLADFEFARSLNDTTNGNQNFRGTLGYLAPEIYQRSRNLTGKVDCWAIGVILYQLCCHYEPFYPFSKCCLDPLEFPDQSWDHMSDDSKDLIALLLEKKPEDRLSAAEALEHRWFISKD